jgi:hypothetical protein
MTGRLTPRGLVRCRPFRRVPHSISGIPLGRATHETDHRTCVTHTKLVHVAGNFRWICHRHILQLNDQALVVARSRLLQGSSQKERKLTYKSDVCHGRQAGCCVPGDVCDRRIRPGTLSGCERCDAAQFLDKRRRSAFAFRARVLVGR